MGSETNKHNVCGLHFFQDYTSYPAIKIRFMGDDSPFREKHGAHASKLADILHIVV